MGGSDQSYLSRTGIKALCQKRIIISSYSHASDNEVCFVKSITHRIGTGTDVCMSWSSSKKVLVLETGKQ